MIEQKERALRKLKSDQKAQIAWRKREASGASSSPHNKRRAGAGPGRPVVEADIPSLPSAIMSILLADGAADPKRRAEIMGLPTSLDQLQQRLSDDFDIVIKRSTLYLRVTPRRCNTIEGKKHKYCLPVKMLKPDNDAHSDHADSRFAGAAFEYAKQLAELLGTTAVAVISQDDKSNVVLGLIAAKKQGHILMRLVEKVSNGCWKRFVMCD